MLSSFGTIIVSNIHSISKILDLYDLENQEMKNKIIILFLFCTITHIDGFSKSFLKSIQDFGVLPTNNPELNKLNLQKAIDWASQSGAALSVDPEAEGYPINSGIILKKNVSLIGVHGPTPRATKHQSKNAPVGSLFKIMDDKMAFITVASGTQIKGIQFWYPHQELKVPDKIIQYPPTIQVSKSSNTQGVTLSNLTFYGEFTTMDFNASPKYPCELILIEHCYGYPLSGQFIKINYCYDIPRILHCHVNPSILRETGLHLSKDVIDAVIDRKTFAFQIDNTDNAQLIDLFTFATWGGIYLGANSYGQLTNFNLDCVAVGIHKKGSNTFNRNWMIAQGSIIANTGKVQSEVHPFIIEGQGHTSISNVEAFSGGNGALTNLGKSQDYLLIRGNEKLTISIFGARMRNYISADPITNENPKAIIQAIACIDKNENSFNLTVIPSMKN